MGTFSNGVSYYDFKFLGRALKDDTYLIETLRYSFKSPKTHMRYIAEVEHYRLDLYAIKFYLKNHVDSPHRCNILTGLHEARPVIHTCIAILVDIYYTNRTASFTFIGSPSYKEIERERREPRNKKENDTQRFRIYSKLMSTYFSEVYFEHRNFRKQSLYLMRNRAAKCTVANIQDMITDIYNIDLID